MKLLLIPKLAPHSFMVGCMACMAICLSACEPRTRPTFDDVAKAKVIEAATATLHAYYSAICKQGLAAEFEFLDSSDAFFWIPSGSTLAWDYDSVAITIRQNATFLDTVCLTWTQLEVAALAPDTAAYSGELHSWSRATSGDTTIADLLESGLLIYRDGKWWLHSGQTRAKKAPR